MVSHSHASLVSYKGINIWQSNTSNLVSTWSTNFVRLKKKCLSSELVAHACNPSYSGGSDQEDCSSKPDQANSSRDPISKKTHHKRAGGVAQVQTPVLRGAGGGEAQNWSVSRGRSPAQVVVYSGKLPPWALGSRDFSGLRPNLAEEAVAQVPLWLIRLFLLHITSSLATKIILCQNTNTS
jgi:hypothetical protein